MGDIVGPVVTIFSGFVVDRVVDVVTSLVVVSTGLAVVVIVGTLVVLVTIVGLEVTFISLLVVVAGTDVEV